MADPIWPTPPKEWPHSCDACGRPIEWCYAGWRHAHPFGLPGGPHVAVLADAPADPPSVAVEPPADAQNPPADPTLGRIDRDIQAAVDEMRPHSLAQRVAIENTLQDRRNHGRPLDLEPAVGAHEPALEPPADWSWQDDPDVVSWDWRQGPDLDELTEVLGRHGVTLTEVDTGTDDVAVRITGPARERTSAPAACGAVAPADDDDDHECDLGACHSGDHECAGCGATWRDAPERCHCGEVDHAMGEDCPVTVADTPEAHSGAGLILGRALLDRHGRVWESDRGKPGGWWLRGPYAMSREMLDVDRGPVREVLLVPVEAGPVLEAALWWRRDVADARLSWPSAVALAAAVDAATSRQPRGPQPASNPCPRCDREDGHGGPCAAIEVPEPPGIEFQTNRHGHVSWECAQCGDGGTWVGVPDRAASARREAWRHVRSAHPDAATSYTNADIWGPEPAAEAAPEPAGGGPGWNRVWLLDCMLPHLPSASYNEPDLHDEAKRQLDALLAELDHLVVVKLPKLARAAAEAEQLVEQAYAAMTEAERQRDAARAELAEVTAERDEMRQLFELGYRRTAEASALWRAEAPAERELIQPDLGALIQWLMERADTARAEVDRWVERHARTVADLETERGTGRAIAHRNGAADGILLARDAVLTPGTAAGDDLEELADAVRSGERKIPTRQDGDDHA